MVSQDEKGENLSDTKPKRSALAGSRIMSTLVTMLLQMMIQRNSRGGRSSIMLMR